VAGVAAACAARSDVRVCAICVVGALKIYWEQVPKIYTQFGSILIVEPLENVFSKNNFSITTKKLVIFFFSGGGKELLGQRSRRGVVISDYKVEILVVYFRVEFERELPAGPQRCITFGWSTFDCGYSL
jgi:hypothetical protein